jgi:hypothetical protein
MGSNDPQNITLTAAENFAKNLETGDTMAVLAFPEDSSANRPYNCTRYGSGFDADQGGWVATIQSLATASGGTPLYDCALRAIDFTQANVPSQNNKAVLLFTDGDDTESNSTADDVIASARSKSMPIYPIALAGANSMELGQIAYETGGGMIYASDVRQLITAYSTLGGVLRGTRPTCTITVNEYMQQGRIAQGGSSLRFLTVRVGEDEVRLPIYLPVYWAQ